MLVIADTSPLRYLTALGEIRLLPTIFGKVCAPAAVVDELTSTSTPTDVRSFIENPPSWLTFQTPEPMFLGLVRSDLGAGEHAALALALQMDADLILIDDAAGRREAMLLGLKVTGVVGVLALAAERGLIDIRDVVPRLHQCGFYIDEKVLRRAFGNWL